MSDKQGAVHLKLTALMRLSVELSVSGVEEKESVFLCIYTEYSYSVTSLLDVGEADMIWVSGSR